MHRNNSTTVEIVAPISNLEEIGLINDLADSFYFGLKGFSHSSQGYDIEAKDIKNIRKLTGNRLYCAFNKMPYVYNEDDFLKQALEITDFVDAVIIQDIGLIESIAKYCSVHLSVGASVINCEEAMFYKDIGASRIIIPPSIRLDEAKQLASVIDIEIFASGILCKALLMGRCWWDSYEKNSSAKRLGVCSKPCINVTGLSAVEPEIDFLHKTAACGIKAVKIAGRGDIKNVISSCKLLRAEGARDVKC